MTTEIKWVRNKPTPGNDRCNYTSRDGRWTISPSYTTARRVGCANQHDGWVLRYQGNYMTKKYTLKGVFKYADNVDVSSLPTT